MTDHRRVGFIGLGHMGGPMATNLVRAGHDLKVHDLDRAKAATQEQLGATWADGWADFADREVVFLALPGPPQVEAVLLGDKGLLQHLAPGSVVIDTTTSSTELLQRVVAFAATRDIEILECPVTNAIDGAIRGELTIFVGGNAEVLESQRPLLDHLATMLLHCGPHGTASTIKLMTNQLWFIHAASIAEGLMLGAKAGIPLETVRKAIVHSAGDSWVAGHDIPSIFAGHYDPSFTLALCNKDLGLIVETAERLGIDIPMTRLAQARFAEATQRYGAAAAELHVARLVEEQADLLLRPPHGEPCP